VDAPDRGRGQTVAELGMWCPCSAAGSEVVVQEGEFVATHLLELEAADPRDHVHRMCISRSARVFSPVRVLGSQRASRYSPTVSSEGGTHVPALTEVTSSETASSAWPRDSNPCA
jgi:hypothetical protein